MSSIYRTEAAGPVPAEHLRVLAARGRPSCSAAAPAGIPKSATAPSIEGTSARRRAELPPEANGNVRWRDTTDALWMRSSLSKVESEAIVEDAEFDDGFRVVRDGESPE